MFAFPTDADMEMERLSSAGVPLPLYLSPSTKLCNMHVTHSSQNSHKIAYWVAISAVSMITSHIISASHAVIFNTLLYLHMKDKLDDTDRHIPCALSHPIYGSFALPLFLSFSLQTLLLSLVHTVASPSSLLLTHPLTCTLWPSSPFILYQVSEWCSHTDMSRKHSFTLYLNLDVFNIKRQPII